MRGGRVFCDFNIARARSVTAKKFRTTRQRVASANRAAKTQHLCPDDITAAVAALNPVADV
jgi:hypothetical protein